MIHNLIFDMGGVLMQHNLPGCIAAFTDLMGAANMQSALGLGTNGEGSANSLMEDFECGRVTEDEFVDAILMASKPGTTRQQVVDAWVMMHGGIPQWKLERIRRWHDAGHHVMLLSNSNAIHKRDVETNYDMSMFDRCFYSHLIHAHKPEKAIYEAVQAFIQQKGWNTCPTLFVDDLEANRIVGEQFGWQTYACIEELAALPG